MQKQNHVVSVSRSKAARSIDACRLLGDRAEEDNGNDDIKLLLPFMFSKAFYGILSDQFLGLVHPNQVKQ